MQCIGPMIGYIGEENQRRQVETEEMVDRLNQALIDSIQWY